MTNLKQYPPKSLSREAESTTNLKQSPPGKLKTFFFLRKDRVDGKRETIHFEILKGEAESMTRLKQYHSKAPIGKAELMIEMKLTGTEETIS